VYGSNARCFRSGYPCLTINKAISLSLSGDTVRVAPGTYNEQITLKPGIAVHGQDRLTTFLQRLLVTQKTDMVVMATSSEFSGFTVTLNSTQAVTLHGIVFPGTTTLNALVQDVTVSVRNPAVSSALTSEVVGVLSNGTGVPLQFHALSNARILVQSSGLGNKRGVWLTGVNTLLARGIDVSVDASTAGAGVSYYGAETSVARANFTCSDCSMSGTSADISQTASSSNIILEGTRLMHSTANSLPFSTLTRPTTWFWGVLTPGTTASTHYLPLGTTTAGGGVGELIENPVGRDCIFKNLVARMTGVPAIALRAYTFSLTQNGGLATSPAVSFTFDSSTPTPFITVINTFSVSFRSTDRVGIKMVIAGGAVSPTGASGVQITMDVY
jgi:hypothetical protein